MKIELIRLTPKYSQLYTNTNYSAPIDVVVNKVTEYDIKSAGLSIIKEYKLLSNKRINQLENMEKYERNVIIGKMRGENPELSKAIKAGIKQARFDLFRGNFIKDEEILSIKNDAIFIIGKKLKNTDFGEVHFIEKNVYSLFHRINNIEIYYNMTHDIFHIKGLNDEIVKLHREYMVTFLKTVFDYIIYDRKNKLKKFLIDFSMLYKSRKLEPGYYKEFNNENIYRYKESVNNFYMHMNDISKDDIDNINISYNYLFYVLPLINRYLFI